MPTVSETLFMIHYIKTWELRKPRLCFPFTQQMYIEHLTEGQETLDCAMNNLDQFSLSENLHSSGRNQK